MRLIATVGLLLLGGCASLPENYERSVSFAAQDTAGTRLARDAAALLQAHPGQTGFRPLLGGIDAMATRMVLADQAERTLDVQYYIWHDDLTGRLFAHALLRAADRGVRVRVLLDDVGTRANDELLLTLDSHAQIEIRLFNPVASRTFRGLGMLTDFSRVNRRMHNKALIADNQRAVLGGRNIGDEYFEANSDVAFGDLDVATMGPVVADVSRAFDAYWNAPMSVPIGALTGRRGRANDLDQVRRELAGFTRAQGETAYVEQGRSAVAAARAAAATDLYWGRAQLLVDDPQKVTRDPDDPQGHLLPQLRALVGELRSELLIVSPYFIPGESGVAWLRGIAAQGVRVTVLTNSLASTDVGAVHAGYAKYRQALLEAGVRLYELKPGALAYARAKGRHKGASGSRASLHAKTFVFDRRTVFIGSLNLDPRSTQLNTEIGVLCEAPAMADALARGVGEAIDELAWRVELAPAAGGKRLVWTATDASGATVRHDSEPEVGTLRRVGVWFLGLLPIESQL